MGKCRQIFHIKCGQKAGALVYLGVPNATFCLAHSAHKEDLYKSLASEKIKEEKKELQEKEKKTSEMELSDSLTVYQEEVETVDLTGGKNREKDAINHDHTYAKQDWVKKTSNKM